MNQTSSEESGNSRATVLSEMLMYRSRRYRARSWKTQSMRGAAVGSARRRSEMARAIQRRCPVIGSRLRSQVHGKRAVLDAPAPVEAAVAVEGAGAGTTSARDVSAAYEEEERCMGLLGESSRRVCAADRPAPDAEDARVGNRRSQYASLAISSCRYLMTRTLSFLAATCMKLYLQCNGHLQ